MNDKNLLEENEPSAQDNEPQDSKTPNFFDTIKNAMKQPGMIAAGIMVIVAIVMILIWAFSGNSEPKTEVLPTNTIPLDLATPIIEIEQDEAPVAVAETIQPTETLVRIPTATVAPRTEVIQYTLKEGDTVASVAAQFGLWPETIIWANRYALEDDLRNYTPGITINILPTDGVYHIWSEGEGLGAVSNYYGVTPEDIINYPANHLSSDTIGSYSSPNISAGTGLVVPGGTLPNYFASDTLLYYAAREQLENLPHGTPETYPAPRTEIIVYEAQAEDSIFSIAEAFDLEPETILWTNRYLIGDTPDGINPGQDLIILPEDGVYHSWLYGEGLNGVSNAYGVTPADILNEPLNNIDVSTIGDLSLPRIKTGTFLYIPGGQGSIPSWVSVVTDPSDPAGSHPSVSYLGGYACNSTSSIRGTGSWVLPTTTSNVGGYEYNPPVHNGLDYSGTTGTPIYASDTGVVIYAGWSDRGYGNTVVISHGNGYLSLYAHLMDGGINVSCGSIVYAGATIGGMGSTGNSTGPHLHFEIRYDGSPVNPHNFGL